MKFFFRRIPFSLVALALLVFAIGIFTISAKRESQDNACGCTPSEIFDPNAKEGVFEGQKVSVPEFSLDNNIGKKVLGTSTGERWIEVNLTEQKIRAWEGNNLFLESLISTGLPWSPTPTGEFRIWLKVRYTRMTGGSGAYYYDLPNVPFVMFFENSANPGYRGYSLHGTYWHHDFGKVHSHGCVNLPTPIAERLYYWTNPVLPDGKSSIMSTADNSGTRIVIHD